MGSKRDRAVAKPQVSEVSKSLQVSEIMFEFMPLISASGQDSNLRSRLRRALLCTPLTSGNMLAEILPGRA